MLVTAKIKVSAGFEIVRTFAVYKKCLQFCVDAAWKYGIRNNVKLHPFVYKRLRKQLPSQLAVACVKQGCGIVKRAKSKPIISNVSIRYNFPRSASFKDGVLSISTVKGRVKVPFTVPACYSQYFGWDVKESLLRMDRKGRCFFMFTFSKDVNAEVSVLQDRTLGIDLGINNLAVTSDGRFYNSATVKQAKRRFRHLRSVLQAKGTKPARRSLRKVSGREQRFMAWVNHKISKDIISNFNGNKIVLEDLKGIRRKRRGRRMNYWISNWSFSQLQFFIRYKAEMKGIEVMRVKPHFTSQICHRCGQIGSRLSGCFSCSHCGLSKFNADLNAGRNLAHPMLVERQAAVNQPIVSNDEAETSYDGLKPSLGTSNCKGAMPHSLL